MSPMACTLLIMAKAPVAGQAKTRLAPAFGSDGAARIAAAALLDTLDMGAPISRTRGTKQRVLGMLRGQINIPDNFDDPLPDEVLALFYGQ